MIIEIAKIVVPLLIAMWSSGCTLQRGWEFNIGVHPVSNVNDQQGFEAKDIAKIKYAKETRRAYAKY